MTETVRLAAQRTEQYSGATAAMNAMVSGETTARKLLEDCLEAIDQDNDTVNAVVHMDIDTYESSTFVLENIKPFLVKGAIILFDELYNFEGWDVGEYKALTEVFDEKDYSFVSFSTDTAQAAIKILN